MTDSTLNQDDHRTIFPAVCAGCTQRFDGSRDKPTREHPYCWTCHHDGTWLRIEHAQTLATLAGYGLRADWWHTGGGCWCLVITRANAAEGWAEQEDGSFVPFVCATDAFEDESGWHVEAGAPKNGEPFGALYYESEDHWCGELGTEAPEVVPADAHALGKFALEHLPEVRVVVPEVSEALGKVADAIDAALFTHRDDVDAALAHRMRELEADLRTASTDAYVAANPRVSPDVL